MKNSVYRAVELFKLHFGTLYATTYPRKDAQLLIYGFVAALDETIAKEVEEKLLEPLMDGI